ALAGGGVAGAGDVALVGGGADDRVGARAGAALAGVGLGAGVAVVAGRAVARGRAGARAGGGVAGAGDVALIGGRADDGVGARARAALAGVGLGAGVAVAAGRAVGVGRVRACAASGITGAGDMTLIGGRANDGVAAGADPALAGVGLRAGIAVVAGRRV